MKETKERIYDHMPTASELEDALFVSDSSDPERDPNDPRSINYKRVHSYPKIKWLKIILCVVTTLLIASGIGLLLHHFFENLYLSIFIPIGFIVLMALIHIKSIVILIVELYQNFAPLKVRERCRFYPSCSDYMILSLKKYGFIKGFIKGVKRFRRCKYPNGGFDYP